MMQALRRSGLILFWPVALFWGADLAISLALRAPLHSRQWYPSVLAVVNSLSFWGVLIALNQASMRAQWKWVCAIFVGVCVAVLLPVNSYLYSIFGEYLGPHHLELMGDRIEILWEYIQSYSRRSPLMILPCAGIVLLSALAWRKSAETMRFGIRTRAATLLLGPAVFLVTLNQLDKHGGSSHVPMDSRTWVTLRGLLTRSMVPLLHRSSYRVQPASLPSKPDFDVLIILNESLGSQKIRAFGYTGSTMPFFEKWVESEPRSFFAFKDAYSNATASDVSLPSILSGVAPYESNVKLHQNPLAWNWARAAGMKTFFLISITRFWCRFDQFFFGPEVDFGVSREQLGAPVYSDLAADEMVLARRYEQLLEEVPRNERLFGVYYAHPMHVPFQDDSPLIDSIPEGRTRYEKALYVLDRAYERIFHALEKSGRLKKTVVIFTGDHGEPDEPVHHVQRLFSYYRETLKIPIMMYVPAELRERHPEWSGGLKTNEGRVVSNLDIVPTVMDLLGAGAEIPAFQMEGRSLLKPVPDDRAAVSLSSNSVKQLSVKGFGIYWKDRSVVFSTREGMALFDHRKDPEQRDNLWSRTPAIERDRIDQFIRRFPELATIYQR